MEKFNDIIAGDMPVLVDFYATWCGPCQMMHPVVEALGKELHDKARVLKIDIDKNQAVANQYRIQSVPTFMIFQKGEVKWRMSGAMDGELLKAELEKLL